MTNEQKTTYAGIISGAFQMAKLIPVLAPFSLIFDCASALGLAILGYFTNKKDV